MATRFDLMKATLRREPVPTPMIISDIRASAANVLQPFVEAGARYRQTHPEAAQKISLAVRAPSKKYQQIEQRISAKIPTLDNISQMGAKFRQSNPVAANKLYTTFQKAHVKTQSIGTIQQRNALAGYTYGSYQSLQKQPVKTAAMFAVGLGSGKAISFVGKVGKAYGAGAKTARVAQAAQIGLVAMYGKQSVDHIMSAPNSYVAGQRAAKIMYTELLPMAVGIKAAQVAPKAVTYTTQRVKFVSNQFKNNVKKMFADESAMAKMSFGKTKKQQLEAAIRLQKKLKKGELTNDEIKYLENKYGTKRLKTPEQKRLEQEKIRKAEAEEIKRKLASGEYKEVKIGTGAQQQIQLVKVEQKVLTKQSLKEVVKLKERFELITKPVVKPKITTKPIQKVKVLTKVQKVEAARLKQMAAQRQAAYQNEMKALADQMQALKRKVVIKTVQKQVLKDKSITKQIIELKQQYRQKLITKQVYEQKLAQLNKQKAKLAQQQKQTLIQAQKTVAIIGVVLTPKSISGVATLIESVQKIKPKEKIKAVIVPKLKPRVAAKPEKKIKPVQKVVPKQVPKRVTKPKPLVVAKAPKMPKPPIVPTIKRKVKKKPIKKKPTQYIIYNPTQLKNRVATLQSLFG